jgi:hypothetical protein
MKRLLILLFGAAIVQAAPVIDPAFALNYTIANLGTAPNVPFSYGGLTFLNSNTLLIAGSANAAGAKVYAMDLVRDGSGHITGFTNTTFFSNAPNIDGGVVVGPGGDIFYTTFPTNTVGQIKPGSTSPDRVIDLTGLGITGGSVGTLAMGPNGMLKIVSFGGSKWYSTNLTPDGSGTYNISAPTAAVALSNGPEGAVYVPLNSPVFTPGSFLISEYSSGMGSTFQSDANGDPLAGTRKVFISGLSGAEGAAIDPATGDFLFSTFGGSSLYRVSGFASPVTAGAPEPGTWVLISTGGVLVGLARIRRKRRCIIQDACQRNPNA